jgi:hypothetical protein
MPAIPDPVRESVTTPEIAPQPYPKRSVERSVLGLEEVITVTGTAPVEVTAGDTAVHVVVELQLTLVAAVFPKSTVVAPLAVEKPAPVMVTVVPPEVEP